MRTNGHHAAPYPVPVRVRPRHRERTGSYLIKVATANHCPPWSFLQLLGNLSSQHQAELTPAACVVMNHDALQRLAGYLGKPAHEITRAMPWILITGTWAEPTVRIRRLGRTFLTSCPRCEQLHGGISQMPPTDPLDLACDRHQQWLVTGERITLDQAPETASAVRRLHRLRRRHGDDRIRALYEDVHGHLTNEWRGTSWHRALVHRWTQRQRWMHPAADPNDEFVHAHTDHWSMLPETVTLIGHLVHYRSPEPTVDAIVKTL